MKTNPRLFGIPIAQTWEQLGIVFENIEIYKIAVVVEIGLFLGGLADLFLLRSQFVPGFHYIGLECDAGVINARIKTQPEILIRDAHNSEVVSDVQARISKYAPALVYCDGGNKPLEMKLYAPILRPGDFLMSHDVLIEVSEQDLVNFGIEFPYMKEINIEDHRKFGLTLWKREN